VTIKLNLGVEVKATGIAKCDTCDHAMVYTGTIRKAGHPLTDPDRRIDGGGPLPLKCPWCGQGVMRYYEK
jgi:hypothetical protein